LATNAKESFSKTSRWLTKAKCLYWKAIWSNS